MTEKPLTDREVLAQRRALAIAPFILESVTKVSQGRVKYDAERLHEAFEVIAGLAPIIDGADLPETDKLALNAAFSFILRAESSGQVTERRMRLTLALLDNLSQFQELGFEFLKVEDMPDETDISDPAGMTPEV